MDGQIAYFESRSRTEAPFRLVRKVAEKEGHKKVAFVTGYSTEKKP